MKTRRVSTVVFLCFFLLLFSGGCIRKSKAPQDEMPQPMPEEPLQKITMERTEVEVSGEENPAEIVETSPQEDIPDPIPSFSGPLHLQRILPQSRILPDGDYCGPFIDFMTADEEVKGAGVLIQNFFQAYGTGNIDERFLYYRRNPLFQEELELFLPHGQEIQGYSAGSLSFSGSRASARIRLYSDSGSITGNIYLARTERKWYLEDWELPLSKWPGEPLQQNVDQLP